MSEDPKYPSAMTMREHIAIRALIGIIGCPRDHEGATTVETRCAKAYEYADEMLKQGRTDER